MNDSAVKLKLDLSDNDSNIHNSFVSPCVSINNFGEEHHTISEDLIQEEFEDQDDPDTETTSQMLQTKKDIVFVRKNPSVLLKTVKNNFSSYESSLTSIGDTGNDRMVQRSAATVSNNDDTRLVPIVKTLVVQQKQRPTQYTSSSSSSGMSPTSLSLSQPDENRNSILLLKAPAAYVSVTTSVKQQYQQQQQQTQQAHHHHSEQIATQQAADYHHHQQHDQRKVLTKLFLPNKIHVKPMQHQKQLQLTTLTNESSSYVGIKHVSQNVTSKIKVLNLRKRFTTSSANH